MAFKAVIFTLEQECDLHNTRIATIQNELQDAIRDATSLAEQRTLSTHDAEVMAWLDAIKKITTQNLNKLHSALKGAKRSLRRCEKSLIKAKGAYVNADSQTLPLISFDGMVA